MTTRSTPAETSPPSSPPEGTPSQKTSYTREEVASLLEEAKVAGAKEIQSKKDSEIATLRRKLEESESVSGFASLDQQSKEEAISVAAIKKVTVDNLIKAGVVPETSRRRLMLQPTISSIWEEVESVKQELGGRGVSADPTVKGLMESFESKPKPTNPDGVLPPQPRGTPGRPMSDAEFVKAYADGDSDDHDRARKIRRSLGV